jgi:hypothetical protein
MCRRTRREVRGGSGECDSSLDLALVGRLLLRGFCGRLEAVLGVGWLAYY